MPSGSALTRSLFDKPIPVNGLIAGLTSWLGLSQLLLWRFLDVMPLWAYCLATGAIIALIWAGIRRVPDAPMAAIRPVPVGTFLLCLCVALILLMLGGEGRFFYSNVDWQIRDAVLRDMSINPWPFVYTARGFHDVLRAHIGMYFIPALAWKAWGQTAADIALLLQNSVLLGILLALASSLLPDRKARWIGLGTFLCFGGLDILGQLIAHRELAEHLEFWPFVVQYSSNITLLFWVPHHALIGWMGVALYLMHREGRISLGQFLAPLPLGALWSPLALIGLLPFAAMAGLGTIYRKQLRLSDIALPVISTLLALPSLLYLGAANQDVGIRPFPLDLLLWFLFQIIEVLPWLVPIGVIAWSVRRNRALVIVIATCLLLMPLVQIGYSADFAMRASVPPLALLMFLVIEALIGHNPAHRETRKWLISVLALASFTGAFEIARAFRYPSAAMGQCSFMKAWDANFGDYPKVTYLAPLSELPEPIRPDDPHPVSAKEPAQCWPQEWHRPSGL